MLLLSSPALATLPGEGEGQDEEALAPARLSSLLKSDRKVLLSHYNPSLPRGSPCQTPYPQLGVCQYFQDGV